MQVEIFSIDSTLSPPIKFFTTSEVLFFNKHQSLLVIDRPESNGGQLEFGAIKIDKILDNSIHLTGLQSAPSGVGHAPVSKKIIIRFL